MVKVMLLPAFVLLLLHLPWLATTRPTTGNAKEVPSPTLSTLSARNVTVGVEGFSTKKTTSNSWTSSSDFSSEENFLSPRQKGEDEETKSEGKESSSLTRRFSPEEVAQYIFLTGNEARVASAVGAEKTRETDWTLSFLEKTKTHLSQLRDQFQAYLFSHRPCEGNNNFSSC